MEKNEISNILHSVKKVFIRGRFSGMPNAIKICTNSQKVFPMHIGSISESNIKREIKRLSFMPYNLEKIVVCYENQLMMAFKLNFKDNNNGFYFKGYYFNSTAIVTKVSFFDSNIKLQLAGVDNIEKHVNFLKDRIFFNLESLSSTQKMQVKLIKHIVECDLNPFDILSFNDKKGALRTYKIIDAVDIIVEGGLYPNIEELFGGTIKVFKSVCLLENTENKYLIAKEVLKNMFKMVAFHGYFQHARQDT